MFGELKSIESLSASLNSSYNAIFFSEFDLRLSSANDIVSLSVSIVRLLNFSAMRLLFARVLDTTLHERHSICRKEESESQRSLVVLCAKSTGMCPLDYEGTRPKLPFGIEQHLFALAREPNMV
jgi:hypothetical protein